MLRGNSGAGKSTVARQLREEYGRGVAWVSQDVIRRLILKERDQPGGANIGLIDQVARYSLDNGYHVIMDGIFSADRYERMLADLNRDHRGLSRFYYLDASVEETLRRHATRPQAAEFGPDDMRQWYQPGDFLTTVRELVIPQASTLQETTSLIVTDTQLLQAPAVRSSECSACGPRSSCKQRVYHDSRPSPCQELTPRWRETLWWIRES